jgi:hypothetical protein
MRSVPAVAFLLAFSAFAGGAAWTAPPAPSTATPAAAPATPVSAASSSSADNEAAARHAKRTACIKQARAKKLVGAQKTAYINGCIGAP